MDNNRITRKKGTNRSNITAVRKPIKESVGKNSSMIGHSNVSLKRIQENDSFEDFEMKAKQYINMDKIIPNWKTMPMGKLLDTVKNIMDKAVLNSGSTASVGESFIGPTNPKWKRSKFAKMDIYELQDYAFQSEENRKELRDFMEENYNYFVKHANDSLVSSMLKSWGNIRGSIYAKNDADPFDFLYRDAETRKIRDELYKNNRLQIELMGWGILIILFLIGVLT